MRHLSIINPLQRRKNGMGNSSKDEIDIDDTRSNISSVAVASIGYVDSGIQNTISHWKVLVFGQILSLVMAGIGATSSELHLICNLSAPTFSLGLMYFLLSFHFFAQFVLHYWKLFKKNPDFDAQRGADATGIELEELPGENIIDINSHKVKHTLPLTSFPLDCAWYNYFLVTLIDVESSFCIVLAYKYTTLTSITLLTSLSVVGAMMTSKLIMNAKYQPTHVIGVIVCISGVAVNIISDITAAEDADEYPHKLLGDLIAAVGGIFFGVNDGLAEVIVKNCNQQQYLGLSGFYGIIICFAQICILERKSIEQFFDGSSTCETPVSIALIALFSVTSYFKFVGDSYFLIFSEAALLNLSLLTTDFYSALFQIFAEQIIPSYTFFLAVLLVVTGVVVYESASSPMAQHGSLEENVKSGTFDVELTRAQTPIPTKNLSLRQFT